MATKVQIMTFEVVQLSGEMRWFNLLRIIAVVFSIV